MKVILKGIKITQKIYPFSERNYQMLNTEGEDKQK